MRHLAVLLCAALLAVAVYVPSHLAHAKPAHAFAACTGTVGTVYQDWRESNNGEPWAGTLVTDGSGQQITVYTHLAAYYVIWSNGFCYEGYSAEVDSPENANLEAHLRAWDPAGTMYDWDVGHIWASELDVQSQWTALSLNVSTPWGTRTIGFGAHGSASNPSVPQASNITSNEGISTWSFWPYSSYENYWYVNINVP